MVAHGLVYYPFVLKWRLPTDCCEQVSSLSR